MPTTPIFVEPTQTPAPVHHGHVSELHDEFTQRLHRLEGEVTELRDTIARFADLMIGEVKDLRKSHHDLPALPPALVGELPAAASDGPDAPTRAPVPPVEPSSRRPWLLMELLRDLGTTFRMYLDPRYRVRRATQLMVPLILGLFALNCFVFNVMFTLMLVSNIFEKIFDVILSFLLYQVIHREVTRYRSVIAQLTAWHDYRARAAVVGAEPAMTQLETE